MTKTQLAYLKIILAIFLWGGVYNAAKTLVNEFDPVGTAVIRWIITTIILCIMLYSKKSIAGFHQNKSNWLLLFAIGFFGITMYMSLFFYAETLITPNIIAILFAFTPCITILINSMFGRSKLSIGIAVGIIIALVGTIIVINLDTPSCNRAFCNNLFYDMSWGELIALALGFCSAIYTVLIETAVRRKIDSISIMTLSGITGTITLFLISLFTTNYHLVFNLSLTYWITMAYVSIFGTLLSYVWYTQAIAVLGVDRVTVFQNGIPFATIIIGALFYSQYISLKILFASLLIILGVFVVNYYTHTKIRELK